MPARRRKLRGGSGGDGGDGGDGSDTVNIQNTKQAAQAANNTLKKGNSWRADVANNPYTTTAVMACAFLFLIPISIYSFFGKSENVLVNEILLSCMAMAISASGVSYYVLQADSEKVFHYILLGICFVSFVSWIYFAYKISSTNDDKDDKDDD